MKILGIDPSLSNFGFALMNYAGGILSLSYTGLSETTPKDKKDKSIRQNAWDMDRCVAHHLALDDFLAFTPDYVVVELPVGSQSARAMASYGAVLGVIARLKAAGYPVLIVTPKQVKEVATGNAEASKKDMIHWAVGKFGTEKLLKSRAGVVLNKNEHIADAIAAVFAGIPQIHTLENEKVAA